MSAEPASPVSGHADQDVEQGQVQGDGGRGHEHLDRDRQQHGAEGGGRDAGPHHRGLRLRGHVARGAVQAARGQGGEHPRPGLHGLHQVFTTVGSGDA